MGPIIDPIDRQILKALLSKGRSTFAELAAQVGLTAPTVHDRVKRLERTGIIQGYAAAVEARLLGFELTALVSITTSSNVPCREYEAQLSEIPEVQECYSVAGEETYVARVITSNSRTLERLLQRIKTLPGTVRTKTTVILSAPISRHSLPAEEEEALPEFSEPGQAFARSSGAR